MVSWGESKLPLPHLIEYNFEILFLESGLILENRTLRVKIRYEIFLLQKKMLIELSTANSLFEVFLWTKRFTKSRGSFITTFWRRRRQWSNSMTAKNFTSQLWTPVLRVPFQMFCRMLLLRWEEWSAAQNGKYAKIEGENCNGYLRICEAARMGVDSPCNESICFDTLFAVFESKENF